jgi:hypothetical protein
MGFDQARQNAFASMQQYAGQAIGQHYATQFSAFGGGVGERAGQFLAGSRFQGALMYGGTIGDNGMANLFQAGANMGNRFSPTAAGAQSMFDAFSSYYGVLGGTARSDQMRKSTAGLSNADLTGVWRDVAQFQQSGGGFEARGARIVDQTLTRLAKAGKISGGANLSQAEESVVLQELKSQGYDATRFGGKITAAARAALGAQDAGVDQYAESYRKLRDIGGATSSLGESVESIANVFDLSKLDKHKITKAASDMAEVAAATGKTFEELGGLFEMVGKMRGVGLTTKLGAARAYAGAVAGIKGGAAALSMQDQNALLNMTTGMEMDVRGSNLAVMSRAFMDKMGAAADMTPGKFYNMMGSSLETLQKEHGTEVAGMVSAYRRGDMATFTRIAEGRQAAMESDVAAANKANAQGQRDPAKIAAVKARYGANVEEVGGEIRISGEAMKAARNVALSQLEAQTGTKGLMDEATKELIKSSLGVTDLSDEQLQGIMGLSDMEGGAAAKEAAIRTLLSPEQAAALKIDPGALDRMQAGVLAATDLQYGDARNNAFAVARSSAVSARAASTLNKKNIDEAVATAQQRGRADTSDALIKSLGGVLKKGAGKEDIQRALSGVLGAFGAVGDGDQEKLAASMAGMDDTAREQFLSQGAEYARAQSELANLVPTADGYAEKQAALKGRQDAARDRMLKLNASAAAYFESATERGAEREGRRADPGQPQVMQVEGKLTVVDGNGFMLTTMRMPNSGTAGPTGK